ncbi:MAG: YbjN domain-containing protein [Phenylobacterium sp.]|uniref:YbjN domain-containing protein n=1 Tax=Phenylobacterium sp. TaxID=1871053 RepID=UPI001A5FFE77|nr:YbjN domain-containing protein [Phenylobacterium sp.]MBL8774056.1 YbjN domain-containing protein [Phenylobacterium sp.]
MRIWLLAACVAWACGAAATATGKPLPEGGLTAVEYARWLEDNGYKADIQKDKDGDAHVDSGADGLRFSVYFYDCRKDRCAALQYYVGFDKGPDTPNLEKVNAFNREKRYIKAYLDTDGDVSFEYDGNLAPGGTWEAVEDDFNTFLGYLPELKKLVNW